MGARDFVRSLRPGDDRALARELRQKEQVRERQREAAQAKAAEEIADRERQRTAGEAEASKQRARRHKQELARKGSRARLI